MVGELLEQLAEAYAGMLPVPQRNCHLDRRPAMISSAGAKRQLRLSLSTRRRRSTNAH
jgi:hypothetical protein